MYCIYLDDTEPDIAIHGQGCPGGSECPVPFTPVTVRIMPNVGKVGGA